MAALLFVRLGHNSLWDDEATTALQAKAVLDTGDTGNMAGHNILAHRNGSMLIDRHDRSVPPLPAYLAAPFIGLLGLNNFAARLPFAILGLGTVVIMLRWLYRSGADWVAWGVTCIAVVGNVSLILYARNCRYYAPTMFFGTLVAYLYVHYDGRRRQLVWLSLASIGLLATQYIGFIAVYATIGVDYLIWGRRKQRLTRNDWLIVLGPLLLVGLLVVGVWNPLLLGLGQGMQETPIGYKFGLMWLTYRDINRAEFAPLVLLAVAPLLYFVTKNVWLLRGSLAVAMMVVVTSLVSPQTFFMSGWTLGQYDAEVRYIVAVIPLCIAVSALAICQLRGRWRWVAVVASPVVFWTNLVHRLPQTRFDREEYSTIAAYLGELANPPKDPYAAASAWLNEHLKQGESVLVFPDYMMYPLMVYSPQAVYAWQLDEEAAKQEQFRQLPDIHVRGRVYPDYVLVFGPEVIAVVQEFRSLPDVRYARAGMLPVYWKANYRPELFWRRFTDTPCEPTRAECIYIYRRQPAF